MSNGPSLFKNTNDENRNENLKNDDLEGCINLEKRNTEQTFEQEREIIPDSQEIPELEATLAQALSYSVSRSEKLNRGELLLSDEESEIVRKVLERFGLLQRWYFKPVVINSSHLKKPKNGKHFHRSRHQKKKNSSALSEAKKKNEHLSLPVVETKREANYQGLASDTSLTMKKAQNRSPGNKLKKLPDWARRLHRVLTLICQTEVCKPFVEQMRASHLSREDLYDANEQFLLPIGLNAIIRKLERNVYHSALEVFNDVYGVWLYSYRCNPPGSEIWIQTFKASKVFLQQISTQPLKDEFTSTEDAVILSETRHDQSPSKPEAGDMVPQNFLPTEDVDKLLEEIFDCKRNGPKKNENEPSAKENFNGTKQNLLVSTIDRKQIFAKHKGAVRKSKNNLSKKFNGSFDSRYPSKFPPAKQEHNEGSMDPCVQLSKSEKMLFHQYLSQMEPRHHLMLYEAFRTTAVWRTLESGEVELDDLRTSAAVLRKMIAWCESQVSFQTPLGGKKKNVTADAQPSENGAVHGLAVEHNSRGKVENRDFIQAHNIGRTTPSSYDSSSSISISSSSSSEESNEVTCPAENQAE